MRRVSTAGAVFALLAILITPAVFAEDPPPGTEPPQARIGPPTGVTATAEPSQVRIGPPGGVTAATEPPQVRIAPPGGVSATDESPSMLELLWVWLRARIGPPTG
jgi:hypothetical protein